MADAAALPTLDFEAGTLALRGLPKSQPELPPQLKWDGRSRCFRAPALDYAAVVLALRDAGLSIEDRCQGYSRLDLGARVQRVPRPYQREALAAWHGNLGRGVVVLPTGSGKTLVALLAIEERGRSALVVAPTLDLVRQWYDRLRLTFCVPVGVIGGGEYAIHDLTVTTYDSAYIHMERLGNRFGLLVFDECHHLPGRAYALGARLSLAPFRLGLTATPERADGREDELTETIGPIVYRRGIQDLSGEYLADYETVRIKVSLSAEEREAYDEARAVYLGFLRSQGIRIASPRGWQEFILRTSISDHGRAAMAAYRRQKELAQAAPAKIDVVESLLEEHRDGQVLVFTQDNATAYAISRRFLIPAITHQTKVRERSEILERFSDGRYGALASSKVLNEGVDIPSASVAIVVSGSGSVREHVQRLGRILRPQDGKRAVLYELVTAETGETFTSKRRRDHDAYR